MIKNKSDIIATRYLLVTNEEEHYSGDATLTKRSKSASRVGQTDAMDLLRGCREGHIAHLGGTFAENA